MTTGQTTPGLAILGTGTALEPALRAATVKPADLELAVFAGMSRDYPPSWPVSTEIMRLLGVSPRGFGFDITSGCPGALAGLDLARGWLATRRRVSGTPYAFGAGLVTVSDS